MITALFDIGNSTISWAIKADQDFVLKGRFQYSRQNLNEQLTQNIQFSDAPRPVIALASSVAEQTIVAQVQDWSEQHWQLKLWQARVGACFGQLKNSYNDPSQMGVDRWLAMIAAWSYYETDLCIVDCGTALTIDVIDSAGDHSGGYILPSVTMMQQALVDKTDNINLSIQDKPLAIKLATDTQTALNHGATLATVATIDRVVGTLSDETKCILTGGTAQYIQPFLAKPFIYMPDLVLDGLAILYKAKP